MILETLQVGPLKVNCHIIGCAKSGEGAIIDAGGSVPALLELVRQRGISVRYLLNTHGHFDHVGGNRALLAAVKAEYLIHEHDGYFLSLAATMGRDFGVLTENSPEPDRFLVDGMVLPLGAMHLEVIHTPGHSPGSCSLYCARAEAVFTGDTLFNGAIGRVDLPGASPAALQRSIRERLFTLPEKTAVLPGHGPVSTIGRERLYNTQVRRG